VSWYTIDLEIRIQGSVVESETTCMWAGPYVLALATTLPSPELAIEIHSSFVGHHGVPTCSTHLTLGPADAGPVISTTTHEDMALDPVINSRQCVYEHWNIVLEQLAALGYTATMLVPRDAFDQLERVEGMT
jgi:hypothetical protein